MKIFHIFSENLRLPYILTKTTLIVKTVELIYLGGFMVTPQQEEVLRVFDFICKQKDDGFDRLFSSVDIVP